MILGEGRPEVRAELLALAAALGSAEEIDLPGFVPNPFAYMARAGVFILSSLHEGLPGPLWVDPLRPGVEDEDVHLLVRDVLHRARREPESAFVRLPRLREALDGDRDVVQRADDSRELPRRLHHIPSGGR